ncbi:MAG: 3'-5' exonuclease [Cyclobacteriaceae bacterium]
MSDYLLFVDTETSGWPKNWHQSYAAEGNWPHVVQAAWMIYTKDGRVVKTENHFISNDDFSISPTSQQIHGISQEFRLAQGKSRKIVLNTLHQDLLQYQPLVIGYFTQLDYHMLSAEFYRLRMDNPLEKLPVFCVMKSAALYSYFPSRKYLSLDRLYEKLFQTPLREHHDALVDTQATARCFFALRQQGRINDKIIARQQQDETVVKVPSTDQRVKLGWLLLAAFLLVVLLYWFLRGA